MLKDGYAVHRRHREVANHHLVLVILDSLNGFDGSGDSFDFNVIEMECEQVRQCRQ
jgi:hypothetical protein